MNWITTNLRLPEDLYMEIKIKAAKERRSVAAVIRERLSMENNKKQKSTDILEMARNIGEKIAKEHKGLNLTKGLIEMRYEQ